MKVVVTGADGNLGSTLLPMLLAENWQVIPVDRRDRGRSPIPVREGDVGDPQVVRDLYKDGADVLVHLANASGCHDPQPQVALDVNLAMSLPLIHEGMLAGVKRVIYASSVHAFINLLYDNQPLPTSPPLTLPVDGSERATPHNFYGLNKAILEQTLEFYTRCHDMTAFALRFPWMPMDLEGLKAHRHRIPPKMARMQAFAYLVMEDAARLIMACIKSDSPGMHVYMPASRHPYMDIPVQEILKTHYADWPLRLPAQEIDALVDVSRITQETGWSPRY